MRRTRSNSGSLWLVVLCAALYVAGGPRGCPSPIPDQPTDAPIQVDRLTVAIIEESGQRSQLAIDKPGMVAAMMSQSWREMVRDAGGQYQLIEHDRVSDRSPSWAIAAAKLERTSLPWLVVADADSGVSIPMPETLEALQQVISGVSDGA